MSNPIKPVDLTDHLPVLLFSLSAKISQHAQKNSARPLGLDMCEWRVIQILGRDGETNVNQVADRLAMDRGGVSRAISRLETRGLIQRQGDPKDRRRSAVQLTQDSMGLHDQVAQFAIQREDALKSCLSAKETADLAAILIKLDHQIDTMLAGQDAT